MNYSDLREQGLEQIQNLSGDIWTDYNTHDPGITILEQFCYALTDLNYRAGFPIEDLMAEDETSLQTDALRPRPMLTSGPVSPEDWRMLLLDIPGVNNAWISPVDTSDANFRPRVYFDPATGQLSLQAEASPAAEPLSIRGLYQIDYVLEAHTEYEEAEVTAAIYQTFQANRNLCEDLYQINRLRSYLIELDAQIEIEGHIDSESVMAQVYTQVDHYFRPTISFYTLQQMQKKGYHLEEIMEGPQMRHGFLDPEELANFDLRQSLRISELIQTLMEIDGVLAIHSLQLIYNRAVIASTLEGAPWEYTIPDDWVASLFIPHQSNANPKVQLRHDGVVINTDWAKAYDQIFASFFAEENEKQFKRFAELDREAPLGRNRQVSVYQSILHQFPELYGVGEVGLPGSSTDERKAQAKQLKAYLSFFDQLLANAFAQLGATSTLFGLKSNNLPQSKTYFSQSLIGESPGIEELIDPELYQVLLEEEGLPLEENQQRQKKLTQHLLARFAERYADFSQQDAARQNETQRAFLNDYPNFSYRRFTAFDYTTTAQDNSSGLQKRLNYLLGFAGINLGELAGLESDHQGAFYLLEHLLLRPHSGDEYQTGPIVLLPFNDDGGALQKDPYSLQLSFVFPDWLDRLEEEGFWSFLTKTLREQTPAHLKIFIHRLNRNQMASFENAYSDWLVQLKLASS